MPSQPSHSSSQRVGVRYLCPADGEVLDALLEARRRGEDAAVSLPPDATPRAQRLTQLLNLLDAMPTVPEADLPPVHSSLIAQIKHRQQFAAQVQMLSETRPGIGVGWRQVASAAAVFLIGLSLLFPFLERNRAEARRLACAANLGDAGVALAQYAADHQHVLPRGTVRPGAVWWNVGQDPAHENGVVSSNSAHLYILVRSGLIDADRLACPENSHAPLGKMTRQHLDWPSPQAVSYSYQNQYTAEPVRIDRNPHLAVLADKNPLFVVRVNRMTFDTSLPQTTPSKIHGNRGQNVLTAGGSVSWTIRPVLRSPGRGGDLDNIWLLRGVQRYSGTEHPQTPDEDSFLVP